MRSSLILLTNIIYECLKFQTAHFGLVSLKKIVTIVLKGLKGKARNRAKTHNQHVVPNGEGWAVRGAGNERVMAKYDYQAGAIKRAIEIAKNYSSDEIIHRENGTIRDRMSY